MNKSISYSDQIALALELIDHHVCSLSPVQEWIQPGVIVAESQNGFVQLSQPYLSSLLFLLSIGDTNKNRQQSE